MSVDLYMLILDFHPMFYSLILARMMQNAGIRAFVGKLSMDISSRPSYIEASASVAMDAVHSFADKCCSLVENIPEHKRLISPVITPRFVPTCSEKLLSGLGDISKNRGMRIQSHLAESYDQVRWVKSERGVDDIEVFDRVRLAFMSWR